MKNDMTSGRRTDIDIVQGIMILYMVYGHIACFAGVLNNNMWINHLLFCFMPWFYYKSGMFYESQHVFMYDRMKRKFFFPYFIYSLFGLCAYWFVLYYQNDKNWIHYFLSPLKEIILTGALGGNSPLWFLPSLFAVIIIFRYLILHKLNAWEITILSGVGTVALYEIKKNLLEEDFPPYYVFNVVAGLFFYSIGYILCKTQYKKNSFFIAVFIYALFIIYGELSLVDFRSNVLIKGNYITYFLSSVITIVMINFIAKLFYKRFRLLQIIGRNSMEIYVRHYPLLLVISCLLSDWEIQIMNRFIIYSTMVLTILIIWHKIDMVRMKE